MDEEKRSLNEESCDEDKPRQKRESNTQKFLWLIFFAGVVYLVIDRLGVGVLFNVIIVLLGISVVIIVHELGHFSAAKLTGMKVEAFSAGFPPTFIGVLRTEKGWRIRILPSLIRKKKAEESADEKLDEPKDFGKLTFTIGKCKKAGETEYRIGLIPFGGYVKVLGQEDIGGIKSSDDPRSYVNRPVWMRMCFVLAGVTCNFILAVIASIFIFNIGINQIPPVVGGVFPGSPAERAGLRAGDEIIEIKGKSKYLEFSNIMEAAVFSGDDEKVPMTIRREDGSIEKVELVSENLSGERGDIKRFGIEQPRSLVIPKLKEEDADDLYGQTGLKAGDVIRAINGIELKSRWHLEEVLEGITARKATLTIERITKDRDGGIKERKTIEGEIPLGLTVHVKKVGDYGLLHYYGLVPRLRVVEVTDEENDQLKAGDVIVGVANIENPILKQLQEATAEYKNSQMPMRVLREDGDGNEMILDINVEPKGSVFSKRASIGIRIVPDLNRAVISRTVEIGGESGEVNILAGAVILSVDGAEVSDFYDIAGEMSKHYGSDVTIEWQGVDGAKGSYLFKAEEWKKSFLIHSTVGVPFVGVPFEGMLRLYKAQTLADAVVMGYLKTVSFMRQAVMTLRKFFAGQISAKQFMGPLGIAKLGYQLVEEKQTMYYFYFFLVIINSFIAVLNCLPLLPFDGGHFVFLLIEKIKGSPVRERIQVSLATVGFILVIAFALYLTFYDILR